MSAWIALALQVSNPIGTAALDARITAVETSTVKQVNGQTPNASGAVTVAVPAPAVTTPPSVADSGTTGTMTGFYALANHTHASKARKDRVTVPVAGFIDVTFSPSFTAGTAPLCVVVAETVRGDTNVVNAQIDGPTSATGFRLRITRTAVSVVSLIGLSVLSVPAQIATPAHYVCLEP